MTSQLNVDTIVDKAGSGGTNVKIGNTSTYVSEGGAVTQNTVQGLTKAWYNLNANTALRDSFNIGSITDEGTGEYEGNFTNAMSNGNYSANGNNSTKGSTNAYSFIISTGDQLNTYGLHSTASIRTNCWAETTQALADSDMVQVSIHGDLA